MTELVHPHEARLADRLPPHAFFMVSALFHYLGPSFAILLFSQVGVLGVAWLRIASAAAVFALWRRPWRILFEGDLRGRALIVALGVTLALMNSAFYLAIDRMPLATVAAIEFVATIVVALVGVRSLRNVAALIVAVAGVFLLIGFQWSGDRLGVLLAIANSALFGVYIVIGHAISRSRGASGIDRLGAAMLVALDRRDADRRRRRCPRALQAFLDPGGDRRWRLVFGYPVRLRSTGHGAVAARNLRAHADALAGDRGHRRGDGSRPGPDPC